MPPLKLLGILRLVTVVVCLWHGGVFAAQIHTFEPSFGAPGEQILIQGSGLDTLKSLSFDTHLADFQILSATQLRATVPGQALSGVLRFTTTAGASGSSGFSFRVAPRVTLFRPTRSAPNSVITLEGANFEEVTGATVGQKSAGFSVTSPTQIQIEIPSDASHGLISIHTPTGRATSSESFTVTDRKPVVDLFTPEIAAPGYQVTVNGINFHDVTRVEVNGKTAQFTAVASTQLHLQIPTDATSGKLKVTTLHGAASSTQSLVVTKLPVITDFQPRIGKPGTPVSLTGVNFGSVTSVVFQGKASSGFALTAPDQIQVTVPEGASSGVIQLRGTAGNGTTSDPFAITTAPIITSFSPPHGRPGNDIVVEGYNLTGVNAVRIGTTAVSVFSVTADTQLHLRIPAGASNGVIEVSRGTAKHSSSEILRIIGNEPVIFSFEPTIGPRATEVTLIGANFDATRKVFFQGHPASFRIVSSDQLIAVVPGTAVSGLIQVQTDSGMGMSSTPFYLPPRLENFTPSKAQTGATVTLSGANLGEATRLEFTPGVSTPIQVLSSNQIRTTVSLEARSGPITVTGPGGRIVSIGSFGLLPRIDAISPELGPVGSLVRVTGTGLIQITNVTFNGLNAPFTNIGPTEVHATVPNGARSGPIEARNSEGAAISLGNFRVTLPTDLSLQLLIQPIHPKLEDSVEWRFTAANPNSDPVSGVELLTTLPANFANYSFVSSQGSFTHSNQVLRARFDILEPQSSATLIIRARASGIGGYTVDGTLSSVETDTSPDNNRARASGQVFNAASLILQIAHEGESLVKIKWPDSDLSVELQARESFTTGEWKAFDGEISSEGGNRVARNPTRVGSRFYRLKLIAP